MGISIETLLEEAEKAKIFKYTYIDGKGKVAINKVWENLDALLTHNNIKVRYNEMSKEIEIVGMADGLGLNAQICECHSLCERNGLKLGMNDIQMFLYRISEKNRYNPVVTYLQNCLNKYRGQKEIDKLCDSLVVPEWFNKNLRDLLVRKWLLNTVNIVFNDGSYGLEGVLVIQGQQGLGKTRWIKSIVPNSAWVKTGLDVDPTDKDKVHQSTKYWICELGELDATMKKDQAKLKAFFTEAKDEYRRPFMRAPEVHPRRTSFYATVNADEFLKDGTGNRRYWVIPVKTMIVDHGIDVDALWGEVMHLLNVENLPHWLEKSELDNVNNNNRAFEQKDDTYIKVSEGFMWDYEKNDWKEVKGTEICKRLSIFSSTRLGQVLKEFEVNSIKKMNGTHYKVPPYKSDDSNFKSICESYFD